jgi:hypothetical protein
LAFGPAAVGLKFDIVDYPMKTVTIDGEHLTLEDVLEVAEGRAR